MLSNRTYLPDFPACISDPQINRVMDLGKLHVLGKNEDSFRELIKRRILNIKELFHFALELIQKLHEVKNVCLGRKDPGNMME